MEVLCDGRYRAGCGNRNACVVCVVVLRRWVFGWVRCPACENTPKLLHVISVTYSLRRNDDEEINCIIGYVSGDGR